MNKMSSQKKTMTRSQRKARLSQLRLIRSQQKTMSWSIKSTPKRTPTSPKMTSRATTTWMS